MAMGESVKISVLSKGSKAKRKRGETCGGRTVSNGIVPVAVGKVKDGNDIKSNISGGSTPSLEGEDVRSDCDRRSLLNKKEIDQLKEEIMKLKREIKKIKKSLDKGLSLNKCISLDYNGPSGRSKIEKRDSIESAQASIEDDTFSTPSVLPANTDAEANQLMKSERSEVLPRSNIAVNGSDSADLTSKAKINSCIKENAPNCVKIDNMESKIVLSQCEEQQRLKGDFVGQLEGTNCIKDPNGVRKNATKGLRRLQNLKQSVRKYIVDNAHNEKNNTVFKRVKINDVDLTKVISNAYEHKPVKSGDYGMKAHRDLAVTTGKDFRSEKNKKKKGRYSGGRIDTNVYSVKFGDSDGED